jgi:hypothetical protein
MGASISYSGTPVNFYFQPYDAGNTGGVKQVKTSINNSPNSDIVNLLSPRDNKPGNGAAATGAIFTNSSMPGQKIDIAYLFNVNGATIDFTVGGSATYTGNIISTGITIPFQLPSGNNTTYSPNFTVPNPTVDTTSAIKTTCTAIGSYGTFTKVTSQSSPNTTYFTVQSASVGGGSLVLRLPGNYINGIIGGSFTINPPPGTLVRPSIFSVTGGSSPVWSGTSAGSNGYDGITDVAYGDISTFSTVRSAYTGSSWTTTGTIQFPSQIYTTNATLYIQYGLNTIDYSSFIGNTVSGSLSYSIDNGGTYTNIGSWTQGATNFQAKPFIVSKPGTANINTIIVRIISRQSNTISFYYNEVTPLIFDMFVAYY